MSGAERPAGPGSRAVDHLVIAYRDLASARQAFEGLGFTVSPDAAHPFGTGNACVYLGDGTYLEPLAILDPPGVESAAAGGNAFAAHARHVASRANPSPLLSAVALRTGDAVADKAAFEGAGLGRADMLEFGRVFRGADGGEIDMRFRLAFAQDAAAPDALLFTCQRLFDAVPDRSAFERHANGARGLKRLVFWDDSEDGTARRFLAEALGQDAASTRIEAGAVEVEVLSSHSIAERYGAALAMRDGTAFAGFVLSCASLDTLRAASEAELRPVGGRLVADLGPDCFVAFEA